MSKCPARYSINWELQLCPRNSHSTDCLGCGLILIHKCLRSRVLRVATYKLITYNIWVGTVHCTMDILWMFTKNIRWLWIAVRIFFSTLSAEMLTCYIIIVGHYMIQDLHVMSRLSNSLHNVGVLWGTNMAAAPWA